jgi:hypothetical protein
LAILKIWLEKRTSQTFEGVKIQISGHHTLTGSTLDLILFAN